MLHPLKNTDLFSEFLCRRGFQKDCANWGKSWYENFKWVYDDVRTEWGKGQLEEMKDRVGL